MSANLDLQKTNTKLVHTTFLQRENQTRHHSYDQELQQFQCIKEGDLKGLEKHLSQFDSDLVGHLSDNLLRHSQYLFVASTTLATRFSIEGGLPSEVAYNLSDLYIQEMDLCRSSEDVTNLQGKMMRDFTLRTAKEKLKPSYSKITIICMDYIYYHLHQPITLVDLSNHIHMSTSSLSTLFIKDTGVAISHYFRERRLEAAENMLKYSDLPYQDIANYLAFSSQSHFIALFKKHTGLTPKVYRNKYFRHNWLNEASPGSEK